MKKFLFMFIFALAMTQSVFATAQEGNVIFIDGEEWMLLGEPIMADSVLFQRMKAVLPKDRSWTTANWDGYTSYWSLKQGHLYLDKITVKFFNNETKETLQEEISKKEMEELFKSYMKNGNIEGSMFSGKLRVAKGACISYVHMGFESRFEEEIFFTMDKGKVTERKDYHNKVLGGADFSNQNDLAQVKKLFLEQVSGLPEFSEIKRLIFTVKNVKMDAQGHITDCDVIVKQAPEVFAQKMKDIIMSIRPWKRLYLYEEYVLPSYNSFSFSMIVKQ